jgi:hypothetical protein
VVRDSIVERARLTFGTPLKGSSVPNSPAGLFRSCRFAYAEDLQPRRVFLGNVPDKIYAFDIALRRIALGEID